jgi:hypothetical protein
MTRFDRAVNLVNFVNMSILLARLSLIYWITFNGCTRSTRCVSWPQAKIANQR